MNILNIGTKCKKIAQNNGKWPPYGVFDYDVSHYYPISCGWLPLLIVTFSFYSEMLCNIVYKEKTFRRYWLESQSPPTIACTSCFSVNNATRHNVHIKNCCTASLSILQSVFFCFLSVEFVIIMDGNTVLFCEVLMVCILTWRVLCVTHIYTVYVCIYHQDIQ